MTSRETLESFKSRIGGLKVAELLEQFPESQAIVFNHFGASCFECPGKTEETVDLAIRVHESLAEEFYRDLAATLKIELKPEKPSPLKDRKT